MKNNHYVHINDLQYIYFSSFGYFMIWLGFCMLGVAVQWVLRMLEILNGHMLITNLLIAAATLCTAGGYQLP